MKMKAVSVMSTHFRLISQIIRICVDPNNNSAARNDQRAHQLHIRSVSTNNPKATYPIRCHCQCTPHALCGKEVALGITNLSFV